jgi:predicted phosphodiesterase
MPQLQLAVISDLHCHSRSDFGGTREESLLIGDAPRLPHGRHPVQALLEIIRTNSNIRAEALLCAGDLTHQASQSGLHASFGFVREIATELGASAVVITTGNHDVESRVGSGDPFRVLKTLHPDFPIRSAEERDRYWTQGFSCTRLSERLEIVAINTAYHHYSEPEARHGTFPEAQIEALSRYLDDRDAAGPIPRIAVLHHHPVIHSPSGIDATDALPNGDRLMECLFARNCRVVIHGHKHFVRLRRCNYSGVPGLILAAGSFSAHLNKLSTNTNNLFHIVGLQELLPHPLGSVRSWEFNYSQGWSKTSIDGSSVPHLSKFGPSPPPNWVQQVIDARASTAAELMTWDALEGQFAFLSHCVPEELLYLKERLEFEGFPVFARGDQCLAAIGQRTVTT